MRVANSDIKIYQGTTHKWELTIYEDNAQNTLSDLTGYLARGQIRKDYTSEEATVDFTCAIPSNIDSNGAAGVIEFSLTAEQTAAIPYGRHVFDIEVYNPVDSNNSVEDVFRVLQGVAYIDPEATRI